MCPLNTACNCIFMNRTSIPIIFFRKYERTCWVNVKALQNRRTVAYISEKKKNAIESNVINLFVTRRSSRYLLLHYPYTLHVGSSGSLIHRHGYSSSNQNLMAAGKSISLEHWLKKQCTRSALRVFLSYIIVWSLINAFAFCTLVNV